MTRVTGWLERDTAADDPRTWVHFSEVRPTDEGLSLIFDLGDDEGIRDRVEILCIEPSTFRIQQMMGVRRLSVVDDHVVLWPRTRRHCEMYFRGAPANATALEGELRVAHARLAQGWLEPLFRDREVFEVGYGKAASGPEPLIRAYASVLENHGVEASVIASPREPQVARALFVDRNWVVAKDFRERIL